MPITSNASPAASHAITRVFRITRAFAHVLLGVLLAATVLPFCNLNCKHKLTRWWSQALLNCFNIQLLTSGVALAGTRQTMLVANHISWVDIFAINAVFPIRFIAKSEVNQWPLLGYLVRKSGTLFINRNAKKDALRVVSEAAHELQLGENFCFFPEGTTSDGTQLLSFKNSVLQAAIDASADILPIAIRYPSPNHQPNIAMAYAGDTSLWQSVQAIARVQNPVVELHFLPKIALKTLPEANRQAVSKLAYAAIYQRLFA